MSAAGMVRTTCPYCGVGCGLQAAADGTISGDPDHPANRGRLCAKGVALGEMLAPEGRLLWPQIDGRRASWDETLDRITAAFARTIAEHGPDAIGFHVSGQFLTEDYYVAKLRAGTNCGACLPEIKKILQDHQSGGAAVTPERSIG